MVGIVRQVVQHLGAQLVAGGQVGDLAGGGVDGDDVEVLVAAEVLAEQDGVAALPRDVGHVARGLVRELAHRAGGRAAVQRLHEDVAAAGAVRLRHGGDPRELPAVRRHPEVAALGLAEEVLDGDGGGLLRRGRQGGDEAGERGGDGRERAGGMADIHRESSLDLNDRSRPGSRIA